MRRLSMICIFVFFTVAAYAETVTLSTYYPSVFGSYDRLRLVPRSTLVGTSCTLGTLYVESGLGVYYCIQDSSGPVWYLMDVPWRRQGNNVYLKDSATSPNANLKVGIGTQNPDYQLTVNNGMLLARGSFTTGTTITTLGSGPKFLWYPRRASFRVGDSTPNAWDSFGIASTVLGGKGNAAYNMGGVVVGGQSNQANGNPAVTINGGSSNDVGGRISTISGGNNNQASGDITVIMGGSSNRNSNQLSTILGGNSNTLNSTGGVLAGGNNNLAQGIQANIFGGQSNSIPSPGYNNTFIYGGSNNTVSANNGNIFGGTGNTVSAVDSTILAGNSNTITGTGSSNIFGGQNNQITASNNNSVFGGENNRIINTSIGNVILGGTNNSINTNFAIAGGNNMQINNDIADTAELFTFVWGNAAAPVVITQGNAFVFYAANAKFGVNVPNPALTNAFEINVATPGSPAKIAYVTNTGDWCNALNECLSTTPGRAKSDQRLKRNIQPITGALEKLLRLRGVTFFWNEKYKFHSLVTSQQIGFIAQEVEEVFPNWVRENKTGIKKLNPDEMDAVIVEAIKELNTLVDTEMSKYDSLLEEKMKEVEKLSAEMMPAN